MYGWLQSEIDTFWLKLKKEADIKWKTDVSYDFIRKM